MKKKLTRRDFLKLSATSAAVLGAAMVPPAVMADGGFVSEQPPVTETPKNTAIPSVPGLSGVLDRAQLDT